MAYRIGVLVSERQGERMTGNGNTKLSRTVIRPVSAETRARHGHPLNPDGSRKFSRLKWQHVVLAVGVTLAAVAVMAVYLSIGPVGWY